MTPDDYEDDVDEQERRREEFAEKWAWKPGEREQVEREMEERAKQIKHDEVMAWCRERAEVREAETARRRDVPTDELGRPLNDPRNRLEPEIVTRSYGAPATQATASMSKEWQDYIKRAIRKASLASDEAMAKAIGQTLGAELKKLDKAVAEINARLTKLEADVGEVRVAALRRTEASTDAEARKRAGDIRRQQQQVDRLRVA